MTQEEKFTLLKLQAFTSTDFEQYRERGEGFRQTLSSAVIACLLLPKGWVVGCEFHQEWGGMYPVHLRLAIQSAPTIKIEIISPSHDSPYWYGRVWFEAGESVAWFYSGDVFEPDAIRASLGVLDEYIDAGYNDADALAVALRMGGHVV
ncbi:conjugation system SOS inhibitor PsiB family protein [Yersinia ruckeri]|uniref:conjugation system SOS inhibitor PsiB family protein n=1 Tax=Yersinia ruckeri TaxID=29486 RepID=UPI000691D6EF|nr:conjugation system SOS inhibitor PsiB family protein [Yersinia ruckeri]AUQ43880.1 conjugation system SOS inhibitor PsiB [Yersinia ruckeri]WMS07362.1 conjugation system SOS inhibitor PsiB family protein [Yersinia ruckeri]